MEGKMTDRSQNSTPINRREFIRTLGAAAAGMALGPSAACRREFPAGKKRRPNLIFIFADQLRAQTTGFGGETQVSTPHLDRFARQGVNFTNAVSNTPICTPYRGSMLTGRYPHACGTICNFIRLPDSERTFGEILREQGYRTGYIGKWHLSGARGVDYEPPGPGRHGFDTWSSYAFEHDQNRIRYFEDGPEPIEPEGYMAEHETQRAIDFLERQEKDEPFCLFLSWGPPHPPYEPWQMPLEYLERYGTVDEIPWSRLTQEERKSWQAWQKPVSFSPRRLDQRPNQRGNRLSDSAVAAYFAMTEWIDTCFGKIMAALDNSGQAQDSIVVFSSDHGEMLNSHGLRGKMIFYDESIRIPFLVRWPRKIRPGTVVDACIGTVDFLPTILGLMGIPVPGNVQGMDLSHRALGLGGPEPEAAVLAGYTGYGSFTPGWEYRGIRSKSHTYARSLQELIKDYGPQKGRIYGPNPEYYLFDNRSDPFQLNNLAADPKYRDIFHEMESVLSAHLERTGDRFLPALEYRQFFDRGRLIKPII